MRRVALSTGLSLSLALPATCAITFCSFGGDLSRSETGWDVLRFALVVTLLECGTICPIVAYRAVANFRLVTHLRDQLHALASRDPLTGLLNRRGFDEAIAGLPANAPIAVCVCDIDHFKRVNDRWGHETGDTVLRTVADQLTKLAQARPSTLVARFGGEEFVLVLSGAGAEQARLWAEMARVRLAARTATGPDGPIAFTASFGVAAAAAFDGDVAALISRADKALYLAKNEGRNRVATERDAPGGALAA